MIRTSANTENTLWVNASRNRTLSNPTYMMGMQHQVNINSVKRFIPQNVTPQSGTTIENPRVDLFNVTFSGSGENLTGGTRAWYYQYPPSGSYDSPTYNAKSYGTNKVYIEDKKTLMGTRQINVYYDFSDLNEQITGATFTWDDVSDASVPAIIDSTFPGNVWRAYNQYIPGNDQYSAIKFQYELTTNSGNTFTGTIYTADIDEVWSKQVWNYYQTTSTAYPQQISFPITYLGKTTVEIEDYGWYYYKIYEQTSPINLNPSLTTNVVDEGILYVIPPDNTETSYTGYSNNNITIYE